MLGLLLLLLRLLLAVGSVGGRGRQRTALALGGSAGRAEAASLLLVELLLVRCVGIGGRLTVALRQSDRAALLRQRT